MDLFLCRHGQTEYNDNGIVQGHMESKINGKGKKQARKLKERLSGKEIDKIYSSSMNQAVETARIVAKPHNLEIETSDRLKEVSRAEFEGERFEDLVEEITSSDTEDYLWKPEGGESLEELKERAVKFLNITRKRHEDENVIAVSHSGTVSSALLGILDHSARNSYRINQENCSINHLRWKTEKGWSINSVNDTAHLG